MLSDLREEYSDRGFDLQDAGSDPFVLLEKWIKEAVEAKVPEPNAMIISTVSAEGHPSSRTVLLKKLSEDSLRFFTNYGSRKSEDIKTNPHVSLLFFWPEQERQVRIEGKAVRSEEAASSEYFSKRPRKSQLGAWASPQSSVVGSRDHLEKLYSDTAEKFRGKEIPRPKNWGGYDVLPVYFEFWQGRSGRMHDRIIFQKQKEKWQTKRLAP